MALEHPLPLGAQLLVAERCLCVDGARGVLSDYEVEKFLHYFGSSPAERKVVYNTLHNFCCVDVR